MLIVISPVDVIASAILDDILPTVAVPDTDKFAKVPILVNPAAVVTVLPSVVLDSICKFSILYSFP